MTCFIPVLRLLTVLGVASSFARAEAVLFQHVAVDSRPPQNPWIKAVADVDHDGKLDIVIGGSKGPLVWYRNSDWQKFVIAEGGYESVDAEAADVDRDGDLDLIVGGVLWYENPLPVSPPHGGVWTAHRIAKHRTHDVELADLNGDSKLDVVVRGQTGFGHKAGHRILVFTQRSPVAWIPRELRCPDGEGLRLADINRDGRPDIVIGGRWLENPSGAEEAPWPDHVFSSEWNYGDCKVDVGDLNGDGRPDIVLAPAEPKGGRYRVAWFEAPVDPRQAPWRQHVIVGEIETVVHALGVADMDGDGAADVVIARMHQGAAPQELNLFLNRERGTSWEKQILSQRGSHNLVLADVNGDGRIDILGANHGGQFQPVELWLNSPNIRSPRRAGAPQGSSQ